MATVWLQSEFGCESILTAWRESTTAAGCIRCATKRATEGSLWVSRLYGQKLVGWWTFVGVVLLRKMVK